MTLIRKSKENPWVFLKQERQRGPRLKAFLFDILLRRMKWRPRKSQSPSPGRSGARLIRQLGLRRLRDM